MENDLENKKCIDLNKALNNKPVDCKRNTEIFWDDDLSKEESIDLMRDILNDTDDYKTKIQMANALKQMGIEITNEDMNFTPEQMTERLKEIDSMLSTVSKASYSKSKKKLMSRRKNKLAKKARRVHRKK